MAFSYPLGCLLIYILNGGKQPSLEETRVPFHRIISFQAGKAARRSQTQWHCVAEDRDGQGLGWHEMAKVTSHYVRAGTRISCPANAGGRGLGGVRVRERTAIPWDTVSNLECFKVKCWHESC